MQNKSRKLKAESKNQTPAISLVGRFSFQRLRERAFNTAFLAQKFQPERRLVGLL
jgi:hypothetical protein